MQLSDATAADDAPVPLPAVKSPPWHLRVVERAGGYAQRASAKAAAHASSRCASQVRSSDEKQQAGHAAAGHSHELGDHAVEGGALEVQRLAHLANALLA
jgi:hypothetical protein